MRGYSLRTEKTYTFWIKRFIHVSWQTPSSQHGGQER
nr:phage integrase N-terminal SAM-like domain-containing protein [Nitrincola nitratireducens]